MVILVSSKNEEDPIKTEGARVATIQNIDFSNTYVSVTPGERTSNGLSPLVSVGIRSLSGEPVPCPLMSVLPVGVR